MNTVELKGHLLTFIASLNDEIALKKILEFSIGVAKDIDNLEDMPIDAIKELELAIEESYQDNEGTDHDELMQMAEEWLKK